MKRLFALFLALIMVVACLSACGNTEEPAPQTQTQTEEEVNGPTPAPPIEGTVTISGEGKEDTALTAQTSVQNPKYQWYLDGEKMLYANSATLQVPVNAAGKAITVGVSAEGYSGEIVSEAVTAVANPSNLKTMAGMYHASKIVGRVFLDETEPTAAHIEWPACGFEFKVNINSGSMKVYYKTTYESTLAVYVDGVKQERPIMMPAPRELSFEVALTPGEHTIKLLRELEPNTYVSQSQMLTSIEFDGVVLDKPADKELYIEFIGESTATGSGSAGTFRPGAGFLVTDHSNTSSFAYQLADQLNADYSIVAKGNVGFLNGDVGQNLNMPYVYDYWWRWSSEMPYTAQRTPDLIIMKIGMNDTEAAGHTLEGFKEGAKSFIGHLRELYGENVPIVWFDRINTGYSEQQFNAMQDLKTELGDENLYITRFDWGLDGAGPATSSVGLASAENHKDIADQLAAYLKENGII